MHLSRLNGVDLSESLLQPFLGRKVEQRDNVGRSVSLLVTG
jgi:hypothetical protein